MGSRDRTVFEFGAFRLDRHRRVLLDGDGAPIRITAKAFDALLLFLERPGQVIERAALMDALWPNTVVDENNLNQVVAALRRALGDDVIATVKGRGYQFVVEVREIPIDSRRSRIRAAWQPPVTGNRRRALVWGAGFLTFGVIGAVVSAWVSTPPPSFDPFLRYAAAPNVDARALDQYQRARDFEMNDGSGAGLAAARDRYRRAIELSPDFALAHARLAINLVNEFALGRERLERYRQLGREHAEAALELDDTLADAYLATGWYHFHDGHERAALMNLDRANDLNPGDAETHWMIGMTLTSLGQWRRALVEFDEAHGLIGDHRRVTMSGMKAYAHAMLREYDAATAAVEEVLRLYPNDSAARNLQALIPLFREGDATWARRLADDPLPSQDPWLEVDPAYFAFYAALYERDYPAGLVYLDAWEGPYWHNYQRMPKASAMAILCELLDRRDRARELWAEALDDLRREAEGPSLRPAVQVAYAEALAAVGDNREADRIARQVLEYAETHAGAAPGVQFVRMDLALRVYLRLGELDRAVALFDAYLAEPGWWSIEGLRPDPRLDVIRDYEPFETLLVKYARN